MRILLTIFLCYLFSPLSFSQCDTENGHPELLYKYWNLRNNFRENFIVNDIDEDGNLTGDGIGTWDPDKAIYTKAGYGFAYERHIAQENNEGTVFVATPGHDYCNNDGNPSINTVIRPSGDNVIALGRLIATLATEYELLERNNQETKRVLNELFLALQTYRRLDMTANQLNAIYCDECKDQGIEPDLSGYSGFFLRADTPSDFHEVMDNPSNPDYLRTGGVAAGLACLYNDPADNDQCHIRDDSDRFRGLFVSQDQVIGLLHGLAFVKKYIPSTKVVSVNGQSYNILDMAQQIAKGMVQRPAHHSGRRIAFPACSNEGQWGPIVNLGDDTQGFFHGMRRLLNFIYPNNGVIAVPKQTLLGFLGKGDYLVWQATITGLTTFGDLGQFYNERMMIGLMTAGNTNYGSKAQDKAKSKWLMQHFSWGILHNKINSISVTDRANMQAILCSMSCEGPCAPILDEANNPYPDEFICNNSKDNNWAGGERWTQNTGAQFVEGALYSGVDFMLAYNLYSLTEYSSYFDPANPTGDTHFKEDLDEIIGQSDILCGAEDEYIYSLSEEIEYESIEWKTESKLEIIGSTTAPQCTVKIKTGSTMEAAGTTWVRAESLNGTCDYKVFEKDMFIGIVEPKVANNHSAKPCSEFSIWVINNPTVAGSDYRYIAIDGGEIISQNGKRAKVKPDEEPFNNQFLFQVEISNECGDFLLSEIFSIPLLPCPKIKRLAITPNPVKTIVNVNLDLDPSWSQKRSPVKVVITNSNRGTVVYTYQQFAAKEVRTIDVSTWKPGLYQLQAQVEGEIQIEQFVIVDDQ